MKRRTVFGMAGALTVGLVAGAGALAFGGHAGGRAGIMKRMASAAIDEALDQAQATPEQRTTIRAARDRVFAAVEEARAEHRGHLEEGLRLFEADQVDAGALETHRRQGEEARRRVHDAVQQSLVEAHDALTPVQRKAVADYVRAHRLGHMH